MHFQLLTILLLSISPITTATPVKGHPSSGLTSTDRSRILSLHNAARYKTGAKPLKWDPSIASSAQHYASQCNGMQHGGAKNHGQNLASLSLPTAPSTHNKRKENVEKTNVDVKKMIEMWTNEKKDYNEDKAADGDLSSGHYTQVVWKATKKVGCGVAVCGEGGKETLMVCEYYPRGNTNEVKGTFVDPKEAYKAMVGV